MLGTRVKDWSLEAALHGESGWEPYLHGYKWFVS